MLTALTLPTRFLDFTAQLFTHPARFVAGFLVDIGQYFSKGGTSNFS